MKDCISTPSPQPSPPAKSAGREGEKRHIRSFVLRQGRFTPAEQRAFTEHWPRYGLSVDAGVLDARRTFGRRAPLVLEIGFGNGEQLLSSSLREPGKNFVGIEVHRPGVGRLMNALASHNVDNVRLYNDDAIAVLEHCIAPSMLDEVRIYFPDPWPKKRHHKRRLLQAPFVRALAACLADGGYLHVATDWQPYADEILGVLTAEPALRNTADGFAARPQWRPLTKFEQRGIARGHAVFDLLFTKRAA